VTSFDNSDNSIALSKKNVAALALVAMSPAIRGFEELDNRPLPDEFDVEHEPDHAEIERSLLLDEPKQSADNLLSDLRDYNFHSVRLLLDKLLATAGIDVRTDSVEFRKFLSKAVYIAVQAFRDADLELSGVSPSPGLDQLINQARASEGELLQSTAPAAEATLAACALVPIVVPDSLPPSYSDRSSPTSPWGL
jgi:hypothetical protein